MPVLGIRGVYKNGVAIPRERLDVPESEVVILFLGEREEGARRSILTYYRGLAKSFDFGRRPDKEYGEELAGIYPELRVVHREVLEALDLEDEYPER